MLNKTAVNLPFKVGKNLPTMTYCILEHLDIPWASRLNLGVPGVPDLTFVNAGIFVDGIGGAFMGNQG